MTTAGHKIDIIILGRKGPGACGTVCGMDWSDPDNILLSKERVRERFGLETGVAYFDLDHLPEKLAAYRDQPGPVLIINARLRISGQFDMRMLLETVDTALEIEGVRRKDR